MIKAFFTGNNNNGNQFNHISIQLRLILNNKDNISDKYLHQLANIRLFTHIDNEKEIFYKNKLTI